MKTNNSTSVFHIRKHKGLIYHKKKLNDKLNKTIKIRDQETKLGLKKNPT